MADSSVTRKDATALIDEIIAVCTKHGLWIAHEDDHGSFMVQRESTSGWLRECVDPKWSRHWLSDGGKSDE